MKHALNSLDDRISSCLDELRNSLSSSVIISDPNLISEAETATFETSQRIPAILKPTCREEVQLILRIANKHKTPIYAVSRGRNWGLGSRVPARPNSLLLELSLLNKITNYSEELQNFSVEPGVSFEQASDFLQENNSSLYLSVIGGPADASIIGNSLERGEGLGPYGIRHQHVCGIHVFLADGTLIKTGFSSMENTKVSATSEIGLGPMLDGLFFQSNFGVVVQMSIWLKRKPNSFRVFMFSVKENQDITKVISGTKALQEQDILRPCSYALWNKYKLLASLRQYPWESSAGGGALRDEKLQKAFSRSWKNTAWFGFGAIYSPNKQISALQIKEVKKLLKPHVSKFITFNRTSAKLLSSKLLKPLITKVSGVDMSEIVNSLYYQSVYLGHPINTSLKSVYWRKKGLIPDEMNPDRDKCGLIWLCHVLPYCATSVVQAKNSIESVCFAHDIEPNIAFLNVSERSLHLFVVLVYDREVCGADHKAMNCYQELANQLFQDGYPAYRLGIHSMDQMLHLGDSELNLLKKIKLSLDPNEIISPGRYM